MAYDDREEIGTLNNKDSLLSAHTYTEYSSLDKVVADKAWNAFVINGFVALPKAWTADRHWPAGREMPGDTDKGIYVVDGFHQLHCVVEAPAAVH